MIYKVKRQIWGLLALLAICLPGMAISCTKAPLSRLESPVSSIHVVMDNNYPPYIFLDESGNPQGILVDQWALWEKYTGVKVELSAIPWEDALEGMKAGKYDVIDTIFYTDERAQIYDFTEAYARIDVPIFFHSNISGISDANDLMGFRVAVKQGDADAEFLKEAGVRDLIYYDSYEEIIQAVERREETIFFIDQPPGLYYLYKYGLQDQFNHSAPLFSGEFHRAVKKGNAVLLSLVDEGFAAISESEYQTINDRWFGIQQGSKWEEFLPYLQAGTSLAFLIILALVVFTRTLQSQVNQRTRELNQALAELRQSERKYREIFNATNEAIFVHTAADGKLLHVNETMLQMYGYDTEEEVLSVDLGDLVLNAPPYAPVDVQEKLQKTLAEGPQVFEWRAKRKDGSAFWVEVSLRSSQIGGEGHILAVVRDISKRKRAEEALRESEELLREALVTANMGSYVLDIATGIWKSSAMLDRIFGIDDSYIRSVEGWSNIIHPEHRQEMSDYFLHEVVERHVRFDREYKIVRHNDGVERWVHGLGSLEIDSQNRPVKMSGVIQDVTEHRQAEQLLRDRERRYRTLVEQIPAVVYIDEVGNGFRSIYVSPQIENILGFTPEEWLQKAPAIWYSLIVDEDREWVDARYRLCAEKGEPFEAEYRIKTADGRILWLHDQAIVLRDENGSPQLIHGVMQDITAHKQAEFEMRQRVMELETLYESGLVISQILDPSEIAKKVIELLEQKLGWHHTTVRLYNPQDESLQLLAFNQPGLKSEAERQEVGERFNTLVASAAQGMSGWAVRSKQVIHSSDLQHDPHYVDTYPGLQSGLYVPMKMGERVIGVISIESEQPDAFSAADERLAATLANQAASALENARLFKSEQKQRQVSDALRDALSAGASMSSSLDFESILDRLLDALERVIPFEGGCIMLVRAESGRIDIAKMRGYKMLDEASLRNLSKFGFEISTVENLHWMLEHRQPMVISDVREYDGWVHIPESNFIYSWMGAPIIVNDEVIALFSLDSTQPNFFTDEHVELMRAFTGQASLALQNARLFEQTERRFREFAALYETSKAISADIDLSSLLNAIVEHARGLLDTASSGIYLYDTEKDELVLTVDTATDVNIGTRLKIGEGAGGVVAKTRQPLRLDDYSTWEGRSPYYEGRKLRAILEVPMLYSGELVGVLTADEIDDSKRKFSEADEHLLSLFASQAAGAIHSARLREQTARRLEQLQALYTIDRAISSTFDLRPILNTVIAQTIVQLNVDAVDVLLYHPSLQKLDFVAGQGFHTQTIEKTSLRLGECFSGQAALERQTVYVADLSTDESRFTRASLLRAESFLELYAVPLIAKGAIKGVIEVFNRSVTSRSAEWLEFLETLAGQAAITIDQTQLFEDLQRANFELAVAYDATIEGWARAMDLRDRETEKHTERVTELTISLAWELGIKDNEVLHIRRGALLHDIGKIGVPDRILHKEGKLTEEEWEVMRQHPQFAHDMLHPIKYLWQALDIPYCHHEKWDGTGYPRGLKGEQIPLAARIFAIVDVWDAVTSDRPYRKAWTEQQALAYIRVQSGKQFDPMVVEAFLKMLGEEE
ncbi:MAG: GAF domain-containing protein [Chloroflexi bacterium]|nr:GAF domain-containing protein [Chloroflexota bacterium]